MLYSMNEMGKHSWLIGKDLEVVCCV